MDNPRELLVQRLRVLDLPVSFGDDHDTINNLIYQGHPVTQMLEMSDDTLISEVQSMIDEYYDATESYLD
jgi:hypothetical protein